MPNGTPFDTPGFGAGDVFVSSTVGVGSAVPGMRSIDVKGGIMEVADIATRDLIPDPAAARNDPAQFRQEGMLCFVQSDQNTYQLQGGIANANWVLFGVSAAALDKTRTSDDAGTLPQGMVVCQSDVTALRIKRCDPAADDFASRPVGIVVPIAGIATLAAGGVRTQWGEEIPVRLIAGLVLPTLGEEILLSTTPGDCTFPGLVGVPAPASGGQLQRVGIFLDPLTYDGGADRLVLAQIDFGHRRTA